MIDVQNPDVRGYTDALNPSPPNTNMPRLDERNLVWTYPMSPEWLAPDIFAWRIASTSINGALADVQDDGSAIALVEDRGAVAVRRGRFYDSITLNLGGTGTVAAIACRVSIRFVDAGGVQRPYIQAQQDVANPGIWCLGSIYVPPAAILQIATLGNGGAGDTVNIAAHGFQQEAGLPVPMIPGLVVNEGP